LSTLAYEGHSLILNDYLNEKSELNLEQAYELYELEDYEDYKIVDTFKKVEDIDDDISEMFLGHKTINYNNEEKELITVTVRGTDSTIEEWSSNFDVGADADDYWDRDNPDWKNKDNHKGFDVTANRLYDEIVRYINSCNLKDCNKVIYIVGHSRGAALANILGTKFNNDNKCNAYIYTYATPNTTTYDIQKCKSELSYPDFSDSSLIDYTQMQCKTLILYGI